jgi:hypothetical protein
MKGRPEKLEGTNEPKRRQTLSYEWDTARGKAIPIMLMASALAPSLKVQPAIQSCATEQ